MIRNRNGSEFINYLAERDRHPEGGRRLPTLKDLSDLLGIGVARLREQLEVARALGFVDVRPRTGIRRLPYTFFPAVWESLGYAIQVDRSHFEEFSDLRKHVETAYWHRAVESLNPQDIQELQKLMERAWEKLRGDPIRIPHREHRELHLSIYRRLENPFVIGLLEAYWEAYESVGLNLYADYEYLQSVWRYHQQMVDAIASGDFDAGYQALVEHADLLHHRPVPLAERDPGLASTTAQ